MHTLQFIAILQTTTYFNPASRVVKSPMSQNCSCNIEKEYLEFAYYSYLPYLWWAFVQP